MVVQLTTMKQPPLSKPIFLLDAKEVFAPECGIGKTLQSITPPLCSCSCSCLSDSPGQEMYSPWDKVQKQPSSGSISLSTLYTHFCNYIFLLWKPRTFGSSPTQPLSHHSFWSQVWLLESKAQLGISYSILCVTTAWQIPCFWRMSEIRFLKFSQMGGRWGMFLYLN